MKNYARFELHLHLDGSLNLPWAYRTSLAEGVIDPSTTFEEYYESMYFTGYKNREDGFRKFDLTCAVMQTKQNLHDSTYNLVKMLYEEGIFYAEMRFASQQHCLKGLTQKEALEAVCNGAKDGMKDFPDIEIRILNCMMHKGDSASVNMEANYETIEATRALMPEGIVVGLDLAGYENNCDFMEYAPLFEKAREYGIPYTIHAGEMGMGEHVMDALAMKAHRIGHGVDCVNNPDWLKAVVDSQVTLEVCVTSNCKKREYELHPIRKLLAAGARCTINSDNMMFSKTDNRYEHYMLKQICVTDEQLLQCAYNAIDAAFCDENTKQKLREKMKKVEAGKLN